MAITISLFCVLFITVFSRFPTLCRTIHLIPLWSYTSHEHTRQILLNIVLFVPVGYFLANFTFPCFTLVISLGISLCVELIQFLTYRGILDVDDLISNVCGAAVGLLIYRLLCKVDKQRLMAWIMIAAGLMGCIMVAVSAAKSNISRG